VEKQSEVWKWQILSELLLFDTERDASRRLEAKWRSYACVTILRANRWPRTALSRRLHSLTTLCYFVLPSRLSNVVSSDYKFSPYNCHRCLLVIITTSVTGRRQWNLTGSQPAKIRTRVFSARWHSFPSNRVTGRYATRFYARKQLLHRNSVRLSVTRVDQSKAVQARITKSSPSGAWKTLVSETVNLFHKSEGGHPERKR